MIVGFGRQRGLETRMLNVKDNRTSARTEALDSNLNHMNPWQKTVLCGMLAVAIAFGLAIPLGFWLRAVPHVPG